tara:strand:- start:32 stop:523 length:492 start_codon:yes stop_codon:yes gene_type:complete
MKKDSKRLAAAGAVGYFATKTEVGKKIINKRQGCSSDLPNKPNSIFYDKTKIQESTSKTRDLTVTEWNVEITDSPNGKVVGHLVGTTKSTTVNDEYIFDETYNFVMKDSFISVMSAYRQKGDTFITTISKINYNILDSNSENKIKSVVINYENKVRKVTIQYE